MIIDPTLVTTIQGSYQRFKEMTSKRELAHLFNEVRHRVEWNKKAGDFEKRPTDERASYYASQKLFRVDYANEEAEDVAQDAGKEENH